MILPLLLSNAYSNVVYVVVNSLCDEIITVYRSMISEILIV